MTRRLTGATGETGPPTFDPRAVARVASRVSLDGIDLVELHFSLPDPAEIPDDWSIGAEWSFESAEEAGVGQLETRLDFSWGLDPESGEGLFVSFLLQYSVAPPDDLDQSELDQFVHWNAVFNAWPYFRELVHNITARTGLGPTIAPVFKMPAAHTQPISK